MNISFRKIRDFYCWVDFYINRGLAMFNSIYQVVKYMAFSTIIIEWLNKIGVPIPQNIIIYLTPAFIILLIIAGMLDVKKFNIIQKQNEIALGCNPKLVDLISRNKNE